MASIAPFDLSPRTNVNPVSVAPNSPGSAPSTESITPDFATVFDVLYEVADALQDSQAGSRKMHYEISREIL